MKVLLKRLEAFFENDRDINRNQNIKKAYEYGYTKTQIANLVQLTPKSISTILDSLTIVNSGVRPHLGNKT
jgi:hypothetical protein